MSELPKNSGQYGYGHSLVVLLNLMYLSVSLSNRVFVWQVLLYSDYNILFSQL